jgi:2,3-diaminopropionate biosynthesis protein SbnB
MFTFHVMGGKDIRAIIEKSRAEIVTCVRDTYLAHHRGETINPNSYFLRFPEKPNARIIALPALLRGEPGTAGMKWIGSFPDNVHRNIPRASAVLLLNDFATGYPYACLEAAQISAARTAASAVLAAQELHGSRSAGKVAVVGGGVIARTILEFLHSLDWTVDQFAVFDSVPAYAGKLAHHADAIGYRGRVSGTLTEAVTDAELVVLATTAGEPYIVDTSTFRPGQTVLNVSLRDIGPDIIAASHNILDDVEHCLNAGTAPDLAVKKFGHRDFIDGTIAELLLGEVTLGDDKPRIFSPFGLGVLDIAVGLTVLTLGTETGHAHEVPDFFADVERW